MVMWALVYDPTERDSADYAMSEAGRLAIASRTAPCVERGSAVGAHDWLSAIVVAPDDCGTRAAWDAVDAFCRAGGVTDTDADLAPGRWHFRHQP